MAAADGRVGDAERLEGKAREAEYWAEREEKENQRP
jgi:hypothetical protein